MQCYTIQHYIKTLFILKINKFTFLTGTVTEYLFYLLQGNSLRSWRMKTSKAGARAGKMVALDCILPTMWSPYNRLVPKFVTAATYNSALF